MAVVTYWGLLVLICTNFKKDCWREQRTSKGVSVPSDNHSDDIPAILVISNTLAIATALTWNEYSVTNTFSLSLKGLLVPCLEDFPALSRSSLLWGVESNFDNSI